MELLLQQILAGVASGGIYACVALAIVMVYQATGHLNFAQGEMAMFSTFIGWQLIQWGMPIWSAILLTIVISFAAGVLIERTIFRPLVHASSLTHVVVFIGLFGILNSMAGFIWDFGIKTFPSPFGDGTLFGLIGKHQAGMIATTACVAAFLYIFFRCTRLGLATRAAADHPVFAKLVGIASENVVSIAWGIAAAIGSIAGMMIAPVVFLEPNMMVSTLLYGFAGAVLGGLTSPVGAVLGGVIVGIMENLSATFIPVVGAELKLPIALFLIIVVLVIKPSGLMGRVVTQRV